MGHGGVATGAIDGKLYIAGGYNSEHDYMSNELVVFDPETETTAWLRQMPTTRQDASGAVIDGKFYVIGGNNSGGVDVVEIYDPATDTWSFGQSAVRHGGWQIDAAVVNGVAYYAHWGNEISFDAYSRNRYDLTLSSGQTLPAPPDSVTITVTDVSDWYGNTPSPNVQGSFTASTGQVPSIAVYQPTGPRRGDITVHYKVVDAENNPVWLLAEYQLHGESTWHPATVQGDTTDIHSTAYEGTLIWKSGTDLPDQEPDDPTFRITPRDNPTLWGNPGTTRIHVDNLAPSTISIDATSGANSFSFWFNEPASEVSATDVSNFAITGGLNINGIKVEEAWATSTITIPTNRRSVGAAVLDGKLYVVGGWNNPNDYYSTVEAYDPVTDTWDPVSNMPTARDQTIVNAVNGKLYVAGGTTEVDWTRVLEVYDPAADSWESRSVADIGHSWHSNGRVINGKIYYNTEWDGQGINVYDPINDSWETLPSAGLRNAGVSMAVIDDKLYIAGGWNDPGQYFDNSLVVFDPVTGTTSGLASMPTSRTMALGAAIDGKFYVIGGDDQSGALSITEIYDPDTNTWTTGPMLPNSSNSRGGGVIEGKLYFSSNAYDPCAIEVLSRDSFELTLADGESLPSPPNSISITASNISDWVGNISSSDISTDFVPSSGDPPTIRVYAGTGWQDHDVHIGYVIEDNESNPVWMLAEYQQMEESVWHPATVTGDTTGITEDQYDTYITWHTGTDLPGQELRRVRFRLTVRDNDTTWGGDDTIILNIDNGAPTWIKAEGDVGSSTFQYWFNEQVTEGTATSTPDFTLSHGLTASSATAIEAWAQQQIIAPLRRHAWDSMDYFMYSAE
jgi:N-acetylneuraminic acid mutarotase